MNMDKYQEQAEKVAFYPSVGANIVYPTLGLAGEAGEVANKVKKIYRDDDGNLSPMAIEKIRDELGDVLWYVAMVAREVKTDLSTIAKLNLQKLHERNRNRLAAQKTLPMELSNVEP